MSKYTIGIMHSMDEGVNVEAKNAQDALSIFINKHMSAWDRYYDAVYPHKNRVYVQECNLNDLLVESLGSAVDSYKVASNE